MHKYSKTLLMILGALLFTLIFGLMGMWIAKKRTAVDAKQTVDGLDPAAMVVEVGKLIELPQDEEPSIAIVRDVEKLKDQEIFNNAKNGDVLLIYVKARRAYLYDQEKGKLVDVAPVNVTGGN